MTREEAIKFVRNTYHTDTEKEVLEILIPELREGESEDERIRKELIGMVKFHCADEHLGRYLNWLEKQKEQKSLNISAASEWLRKHICNYMNSEYNEFHKCVEYDGSIDKERLINDFEEAMQEKQKPIQPNIEREYIEKRLKGLIDKEGEYYRGAREELAHLFYILGGQPSQYLINNIATEEQSPKSVETETLKINKNIWHVCTRDVFIDGKPVYLKGDIVNSDDFLLVLDVPTAKAAFHRVWFPNNDEEKFCNAVLHRNPDKQ